jgi:hypothetical protein
MLSLTLATVQAELNLYGYSIFMILGTIRNTFIVLIFNQNHQNTCSIYLLSSAIVNGIYLIVSGLFALFPYNYIDETPLAFAVE